MDGVQNAIFTVTGDVLVTHIEALIEDVAVDNALAETKLIWNSTSYGDTDLCAVLDLDSAAVGTVLSITGTLSDALQSNANGLMPAMALKGLECKGGGTIDILCGADRGTGGATVSFIVWYLPLSNDGAIA